jgi:hypothetical protein
MYFGLLVPLHPPVQESSHQHGATLPRNSTRMHGLALLWRAIANLIA